MRGGVERTMEREQAKRAEARLHAQLPGATAPLDQKIGMIMRSGYGLGKQKQGRRGPYGQPPNPTFPHCLAHRRMSLKQAR
jgi:hypothetical protein